MKQNKLAYRMVVMGYWIGFTAFLLSMIAGLHAAFPLHTYAADQESQTAPPTHATNFSISGLQMLLRDTYEVSKSKTWLLLSAELLRGEHLRATVSGIADYNVEWANEDRDDLEARLSEAVIRGVHSQVNWSIGKQITHFGGSNPLSPFQDLDPIDERYPSFFFDNATWKQLSSWTLAGTYTHDSFSITSAYAPLFSGNQYSLFNTDWVVISNTPMRIRILYDFAIDECQNRSYFRWFDEYLAQGKSIADGGYLPDTDFPDDNARNGQFVSILKYKAEPFNLEMLYCNGWDRYPTIQVSPELYDVIAYGTVMKDEAERFVHGLATSSLIYKRRQMLGFTMTYSRNTITGKFECAFKDGETVYTEYYKQCRREAVDVCLSIDASLFSRLNLHSGMLASIIPDIPHNAWRKSLETLWYGQADVCFYKQNDAYLNLWLDLSSKAILCDLGARLKFTNAVSIQLGSHLYGNKRSYRYELSPKPDDAYVMAVLHKDI